MSFPQESPAPPSPNRDLTGRVLGDYQLLRRLGRGAMADVYLAEQRSLSRKVAIKVLKVELAGDEMYIRRFRNEAQAAAALVCAQIVQIHEVGYLDGVHYIVQEYVDGQNLSELLASRGPVTTRQAIDIMRQATLALHRAARQGIIHRDIKPENIMISRQGEVKVADFGLARIVQEGQAVELTQVGITLGTPLYMSPEQVEGHSLDPRSDLYSLGVTCYHMLAGQPPFRGDTPLSVAVQHLKKDPEALDTLRPELPRQLTQLVHRLLAKSPADRPHDAAEVLTTLRQLDHDPQAADWWREVDLPSLRSPAPESTASLAALSQAMQAQPARRSQAARLAWLLLLVAAGVVGAALAWAARPHDLLADADPTRTHVPRRPTVHAQWYWASRDGSEAAWLSIPQYFPEPENDYYVARAQQRLALLYLRQDRLNEAERIFQDFSIREDNQAEFKAFGWAGLCVVASLQGQPALSQRIAEKLHDRPDDLRDEEMRRILSRVLPANRKALAQQHADEFETWLTEKFPDEES
jgi:serine/threonine-protein kinase